MPSDTKSTRSTIHPAPATPPAWVDEIALDIARVIASRTRPDLEGDTPETYRNSEEYIRHLAGVQVGVIGVIVKSLNGKA